MKPNGGRGKVRKKNRLIHGVGVNDADYVTQINETYIDENGKSKARVMWRCPYYSRWTLMLARCYNKNELVKGPSYEDKYVCDEWLTFSNFRSWMVQQKWKKEMHLDKDILVPANKVYSTETCCFVPEKVNALLVVSRNNLGEQPLGVTYNKKNRNYNAQVNSRDHINSSRHLGTFYTPLEAHHAWQIGKAAVIERTVNWWKTCEEFSDTYNDRAAEALLKRAANLRYNAENNIETKEFW
jgi:hypothetical protein